MSGIAEVLANLGFRGLAPPGAKREGDGRTPSGAFAISIAAAGIFYVMTFGLIGVATDFRYAHWGVLANLAGLVPALLARAEQRARANLSAPPSP